jgi:hypothetical protein
MCENIEITMENEKYYMNVLVLIDKLKSASESINKDKPGCIQIV